ncbi:hypothetical protein VNO77_22878 [Canavalia gladiata]|uniref:Uncharacterized protein n=1 Tax=Canavalia gladiata TaxID=3824 RepID=A0AAN9QBD4_CANGL
MGINGNDQGIFGILLIGTGWELIRKIRGIFGILLIGLNERKSRMVLPGFEEWTWDMSHAGFESASLDIRESMFSTRLSAYLMLCHSILSQDCGLHGVHSRTSPLLCLLFVLVIHFAWMLSLHLEVAVVWLIWGNLHAPALFLASMFAGAAIIYPCPQARLI